MTLDFWARTSGTWINVLTVGSGTAIGLLLKQHLPPRMQRVLTQTVGLFVLFIGIQMSQSLTQVRVGQANGVILGLVAMVLGGLLGEWAQLEVQLQRLGDWLKQRFQGQGRFTEGFVVASVLFCVGPMTLIGSLNNGLSGDDTLLTLKATMDGITAIALTTSFGIGVGFSTLVILIYQGALSLAAALLSQVLPNPGQDPGILLITGVGGLMIVGTGFNLLEMAQMPVASFLPALAIAWLLVQLATGFT